MKENFNNWINSLNPFQQGLFILLFGMAFTVYSSYLHKTWKTEGYKWFKPFRRAGKTQSEDNFVIIMHTRTFLMIWGGYGIILFGLYKILSHFVME